MNKLISAAAVLAAALAVQSCGERNFRISGSITEAADSLLLLERVGIDGVETVDSARLDKGGSFDFRSANPEANPEFYRLRIAGSIINVSIDSCEAVEIEASYPTMPTAYKVSGSDNCTRIADLARRQIALQQAAVALEQSRTLSPAELNDSVMRLAEAYKREVTRQYIYADPAATSSYFALFQMVGPYMIFNPQASRDDMKAFGAVATAWDLRYPGTARTENLHNITIKTMTDERIVQQRQSQSIDASQVSESGIIDIALTDNRGRLRRLSDLKGKAVMLDFHVFGVKESPERILMLRSLYNEFHSQGFEIYQVSVDPDEHFWKQQTASLPWISVREPDGAGATTLRLYNVSALPEYFLIDRSNTLVCRSSQVRDIKEAVRKLL